MGDQVFVAGLYRSAVVVTLLRFFTPPVARTLPFERSVAAPNQRALDIAPALDQLFAAGS